MMSTANGDQKTDKEGGQDSKSSVDNQPFDLEAHYDASLLPPDKFICSMKSNQSKTIEGPSITASMILDILLGGKALIPSLNNDANFAQENDDLVHLKTIEKELMAACEFGDVVDVMKKTIEFTLLVVKMEDFVETSLSIANVKRTRQNSDKIPDAAILNQEEVNFPRNEDEVTQSTDSITLNYLQETENIAVVPDEERNGKFVHKPAQVLEWLPRSMPKSTSGRNVVHGPRRHTLPKLTKILDVERERELRRLACQKLNTGHNKHHLSSLPKLTNILDMQRERERQMRTTVNYDRPLNCDSSAPSQNRAYRFQCSVCLRKFYESTHLKDHIKTHTGERPHLCPVNGCGSRFIQRTNLRTHLKKQHQMEEETVRRVTARAAKKKSSEGKRGQIILRHSCGFPGCGKSFEKLPTLILHMKIHDIV